MTDDAIQTTSTESTQTFDCPQCGERVARRNGVFVCDGCSFVPSHGAD